MRILVTGGAGYIGSHTAKELYKAGHEPVVVDDLSTGHSHAVRWGPLVVGDCGDSELVRSVLREYEIAAVMHFAASAYVGESVTNPRKYFNNNVQNSLRLLDAMLDEGVSRIVFSSSCATYGLQQQALLDESHPQKPLSPYGESKLMVERFLDWYGRAFGLDWVALRYFNAAGADLEGDLREEHDPETHIVPSIIEAAQGVRPFVEIFGSDYETRDGTAVRDYVHVSDLAHAHVLAADYLMTGGQSQAFNLGAGTGYSIRQVVAAVRRASGAEVPVKELPRRTGDPSLLVADSSRARSILGWVPERSALDTIVRSALSATDLALTGGAHSAAAGY